MGRISRCTPINSAVPEIEPRRLLLFFLIRVSDRSFNHWRLTSRLMRTENVSDNRPEQPDHWCDLFISEAGHHEKHSRNDNHWNREEAKNLPRILIS